MISSHHSWGRYGRSWGSSECVCVCDWSHNWIYCVVECRKWLLLRNIASSSSIPVCWKLFAVFHSKFKRDQMNGLNQPPIIKWRGFVREIWPACHCVWEIQGINYSTTHPLNGWLFTWLGLDWIWRWATPDVCVAYGRYLMGQSFQLFYHASLSFFVCTRVCVWLWCV